MRTGRLLILGMASALVMGCGFQPIYADRDVNVVGELARIEVMPIAAPAEAGYQLEQALKKKFNSVTGKSGRYQLVTRLKENRETLAVTVNADVVRYNYVLTVDYALIDQQTKQRKLGKITSVTGYGVVASQFATLVGEEDAILKATTDLANKLEVELALYVKGAREVQLSPDAPPKRERSDRIGPDREVIERVDGVQVDEEVDDLGLELIDDTKVQSAPDEGN